MAATNKLLGQHFLKCLWAADAVKHSLKIKKTDFLIEVGPGNGALTRILAQTKAKIIAVEKDEKLADSLKKNLSSENIYNVKIITGDIIKILKDKSLSDICHSKNYKIAGNIPYYLTSHLLQLISASVDKPKSVVFMIPKEVALRAISQPPHLNLLAISLQTFGKIKIITSVPKKCFKPQPKIDSAIIKILPFKKNFFEKNGIDEDNFFSLARKAFGQKRKIIGHSLGISGIASISELTKKRPQELSFADWKKIYRLVPV